VFPEFPDPDWPTGDPAGQGLDQAGLDQAAGAAQGFDSHCLLVIRHGVLVGEYYFNGATAQTTPDSWSIAKSYSATTVGIAIGNHDLPGLDMKAADYIPSWAGTPRADITLRNLVTMTSGLKWSIFQDYIEMVMFSQNHSDFAVGIDADAPPGTKWVYHNGAVQVIEPLFRAAVGRTIEDYARDHLWTKIGMTSASWKHDGAGNPTTYANVLATCRDHARFGYLYLRGGKWKSEQVIPADWVTAATAPSNPFNQGYGYLMWLNGHAPTMSAMNKTSDETLAPWAPADMFSARGFGGQFIDIIPSLDLIVVRFGKSPMDDLSANPLAAGQQLAADELSDTDKHRSILEPILNAVHE
jgi:CubicO group peptidase (beta-lactamase class C family)